MAIQKITKTFAPKVKEIHYLSKTFPEFRDNLINFAKVYFPNTYNDFNESSPGMLFIEMASYVGDVLSYYMDNQFKENLLQYTQETGNIISIAQSLGYKPKPSAAATVDLDIYQLVPALGSGQNYQPDSRYYLKLAANAMFSNGQSTPINFRTITPFDFNDPTDREITVYATDTFNTPLTYLVKKKISVFAGDVKTTTFTFGAPEKFNVVTIPDTNILEISSVIDSNNNAWSEVDFLAQDVVFVDVVNSAPYSGSDESLPPLQTIQLKKTPRRFVTRYDANYNLELHFGSGVTDDDDSSVSLETKKLVSSEYQTNLASTSLDPADFLGTNSYGLAPSNTTLTVSYVVGGGVASNVASNTIQTVKTLNVLNDTRAFTPAELTLFNSIVASVAVNNSEPATGGRGSETVEEIRQNALAFFNAQNRLVTKEDYLVRSYAMPQKYGAIAKSFVIQDEQINQVLTTTSAPINGVLAQDLIQPSAVNLYVLGFDSNGNLTTLNRTTKQNLKSYLDAYRMLTDQINILDAFVVNIGVEFRIVVFKNYNINDVLVACIDAIKDFFSVDKWSINQPIILTDLATQIGQVDGVQSILNLQITNKYQVQDGSDYSQFVYDINAATDNGIVYPSLDPCIFSIKYPDSDIVGSAVQ